MSGLLFLATLVAYLPALQGRPLWDDDGHITKPVLRSLDGLRRIWLDLGATQQYYPLLHSAFWLEYKLWGDAVVGYHLTNIVLHTIAALLAVAVVRRLAIPGAWLAGFIFALHPVSVEAVAWISEQKSTLSTVFYLAAALVYLDFDRTRRRRDYVVALALFAMALVSKTVAATLPAALLVLFWWMRGRLDAKRDVLPLTPFLAIGAGAGLFTAWVERTYIGAQGPDFGLNLLQRALLAGRVVWFYFEKLIWPANLMFFYPHWIIDSGAWRQYLPPAGLLLTAAAFVRIAPRNRGPLAALLMFVGTLFPVLGFLNVYPFVYSYVADHFVYLASLAVIVPLSATLTIGARRILFAPRIAGAAVLAVLGLLTFRESGTYRDLETLYRATLARNPGSWICHNNLGNYLLNSKSGIPEAIEHFQAALKLKPDSAEAMNNLGSAYSRIGRLPEAAAMFEAALRVRPKFPDAEDNLGGVLAKMPGHEQDAISHFEAALEMNPDLARAHNNLGAALISIPGRKQDAIREYETALQLDPGLAEVHNNLGNALAELPGRENDAIAEYEAALRQDPNVAAAHANLGSALAQAGRDAEAMQHFEQALRLDANSAVAHNGVGLLAAKKGKLDEAAAEYEKALKIDPHLGEAHNNIGTLLAQSGRMREALPHFEAAVKDRPDSVEARMNLANALSDLPGRQAEAAENYRFVVQARPEFAEGHYMLGLVLAKTPGQEDNAIAEFDAALKIKPDPEVQALVDRMKSTRGRAEEARRR